MMSAFRLRPSAAAVWTVCNAHVQMTERYPETATHAAADEGTVAHWVWHQAVTTGVMPAAGSTGPMGVVITPEMIEGARMFIERISSHGVALRNVNLERQRSTGTIHEQHGGTPDADAWNPLAATLFIDDYKYGFGFVEVFQNPQLMAYAAEILEELGIDGIRDQHTYVEFCIVQPRAYHRDGPVRTWRVLAAHLRQHFNHLRTSAEAALGPSPHAVTGAHCLHCSARHACETLQKEAYRAFHITGSMTPHDITPAAAGRELQLLVDLEATIKARKTGMQEQVEAAIRRGGRVPGWELEATKGRTVWIDDVATRKAIGVSAAMGVNVAKPIEAITPRQAILAGVDAAVIKPYTMTNPSKMTLVRSNTITTQKQFAKD